MNAVTSSSDDKHDLRQKFIDGMSYVAATVNVVTTAGAAGRSGVTVSAMSSVSADTQKPTLLVCVNENSAAAKSIIDNGIFCVNILRDDQSYISDTFAGRYKDKIDDKFDCADWVTQVTGAPRVSDALAAFDCKIVSTEKIGAHHVVFGEVVDVYTAPKGSPLIYYNRSYRSSTAIDAPAWSNTTGKAAERLTVGCFHTFGPFILPRVLRETIDKFGPLQLSLVEGDHTRMIQGLGSRDIELALMYEFGLNDQLDYCELTRLTPYVLLAGGHPLAEHSELTATMLAEHPMISVSEGASADYLESIFSENKLKPAIAFRPSSFEMARGMVGHGLGYAIMMTKPADSTTYDGRPLVARRLSSNMKSNGVVLAWRKGELLSDAASNFVAGCKRTFQHSKGN